MIRSKHKIYGEPNDPNTVINTNPITEGKYFVVGSGNKGIRPILIPPNSIIITNFNGKITYLDFNNQRSKVIATDGNGDIVLIDRSELE